VWECPREQANLTNVSFDVDFIQVMHHFEIYFIHVWLMPLLEQLSFVGYVKTWKMDGLKLVHSLMHGLVNVAPSDG